MEQSLPPVLMKATSIPQLIQVLLGHSAHLAAVASGAHIYTSSDSGVTWEQVTDSVVAGVSGTTTANWYSITSSSDGTKLAAGVFSGYIYTGTK